MLWCSGVVQEAKRFMTSWHKEKDEASRQRMIKRDDNESRSSNRRHLTTGRGGGNRRAKRRGKKPNEKRRNEWHDMCRMESIRPPPPRDDMLCVQLWLCFFACCVSLWEDWFGSFVVCV